MMDGELGAFLRSRREALRRPTWGLPRARAAARPVCAGRSWRRWPR
ncbi:hypothetical protein [Micromonospora sp. WMMB482]|nr:hypothetical protein [Micromonospora sp. WMMB482]